MVTVAPILVVLAAGYVTGIFLLLIERCVRGNILKTGHVEAFGDGGKMNNEGRCKINNKPD
jgi:hypothetical protein